MTDARLREQCAYCGEPMNVIVRGHHHTENGTDVTRPYRTADPTCAERIAEYMAGRTETIGALQVAADNSRGYMTVEGESLTADDARERLAEIPLSVEIVRHVRILFGTGGPADWLDATLYDDGSVRSLEYTFQDWFDSASVAVESDSPLWRYAESVVDSQYFLLHDENGNAR